MRENRIVHGRHDSIADFLAAHAKNIIAAFLALYLAAGIGAFAFSGATPSPTIAPVQALAFARSAGLAGNVLNSGEFGGFLISEGVKTFVDGRSDQLFGNAFLQDILETSRANGSRKLDWMLDKYHIQWVLLQVSDNRVPLFDGNAGWKRLYRDKTAVIYGRSF